MLSEGRANLDCYLADMTAPRADLNKTYADLECSLADLTAPSADLNSHLADIQLHLAHLTEPPAHLTAHPADLQRPLADLTSHTADLRNISPSIARLLFYPYFVPFMIVKFSIHKQVGSNMTGVNLQPPSTFAVCNCRFD